ncbi:MAG: GNAT family N-acetyltransferase [Spirochaetia bacterium]|jgi:GNAT superfamily N-acetyltransferase
MVGYWRPEEGLQHLECRLGNYLISTNREKLDLRVIHEYLSHHSYWAQGRPRDVVNRSVENSLCFGLYDAVGRQIGFARVVTDYATFGWLCDVFILEAEKGKGLGKWLIETIVDYPELSQLQRLMLGTKDAHALYGGFENLKEPAKWMERVAVQNQQKQG